MSTDATVTLTYGDETVAVQPGSRLLDCLLAAGFDHRHVCGGHGFCTSCRVEVVDGDAGLSLTSDLERERLGRDAGRLRLACQSFVRGPVRVRVPRPISRYGPDEL
jgi:ferredoxin